MKYLFAVIMFPGRAAFCMGVLFLLSCCFAMASESQDDGSSPLSTAGTAIDSGNQALSCKNSAEAEDFFLQASGLPGNDAEVRLIAELNLARRAPTEQKLDKLQTLYDEIAALEANNDAARLLINLAHQAYQGDDLKLAYRALSAADEKLENDPVPPHAIRLRAESLELMSHLYEDQRRYQESLYLTQSALELTAKLTEAANIDLEMKLHWRLGRLYRALNKPEHSLAEYQVAAEKLQSLRQDMPIEDYFGRSTYNTVIKPLYMGLIDLLLASVRQQRAYPVKHYLEKAREAIENLHLAEMQDFLGDRCTVESEQVTDESLPPGIALLYLMPVNNRIELLIETAAGLHHKTVQLKDSDNLRDTARLFSRQTRHGLDGYKNTGSTLYDWLIRPVEPVLTEEKIETLLIVPSSELRMVSMSALYDGRRYLVEKLAVSTLTAMSMTQQGLNGGQKIAALVSGMSEVGDVSEKLVTSGINLFASDNSRQLRSAGIAAQLGTLRSVGSGMSALAEKNNPFQTEATLRDAEEVAFMAELLADALALPGVRQEVVSVSETLGATQLLNEDFTIGNFSSEFEHGQYRIFHIASHGMFGGDASSSFILAYDDLITLNKLQSLINSEKTRRTPIDLLALSACQTAEGNEKAPLGIAGAAIKARARSVLGTLWPVEDNAARDFMKNFYDSHVNKGLSKVASLRHSQVELLSRPATRHPIFWAPFVLIGNWQ